MQANHTLINRLLKRRVVVRAVWRNAAAALIRISDQLELLDAPGIIPCC